MKLKHKYEEIEESIINWALEGKYNPHEKLPTESELVKMFNVSRHTIRKAISNLVSKEYVYSIQGSGMYVSDWVEHSQTLKNNNNIAVLTTHISNYIFPNIIKGVEDTLYLESYSLLLSSTNNNVMFENSNLKNLLAHKINGLILEPTKSAYQNPNIGYINNIISKNIPIVTINSSYPNINTPSLVVDDFKGGELATNHLISLGHEQLLGIFKVDDSQGIHRMNGFISRCQKSGLPPANSQILTYLTEEIDLSLSYKIESVLNSEKRPTGIFCYNDEIAYMVMTIAADLNISIPDELSVIGYDDSQLSVIMQPNLTSITHPKEQMGKDAAELIIKLINNNNVFDESDSILYEPELIIRNSTSKIKK